MNYRQEADDSIQERIKHVDMNPIAGGEYKGD